MLEKLRSGEPLTAKEKQIHDQGLVTVLRQIHDELDAAVLGPHLAEATPLEYLERWQNANRLLGDNAAPSS